MTAPDGDLVLLERSGHLAVLRLNDPQKLNPISKPLQHQLLEHLQALAQDPEVHSLVLTGEGRAFCVGADLKGMRKPGGDGRLGPQVSAEMESLSNRLIEAIRAMPCPVLAAVNGPCAGAGVGLALAADICVATESAYFYLPFMPRLGIVPDLGCTWFLERMVGRSRAMALALLGEQIKAADAQRLGLIWAALPDADFEAATRALAQRLADLPGHAAVEMRAALEHAATHTLSEQLHYEASRQGELIDRPSFSEGVRAFLEKRTPRFR